MSIELIQLADLRDKVSALTRKCDRQALLLESLWHFVKDRFELGDDDLKAQFEKLREAAEADDRPVDTSAGVCPACEEPVKGDRESCFWCGHKFPAGLFGP